MLSTRYRIFAISLAVLIVLGAVVSATAAIPSATEKKFSNKYPNVQHVNKVEYFTSIRPSATEKIKPFDHVFLIVMENQGTESIIGEPEMPFTNYLAQTYGYADNYYGVTHPSMPNYIAMTSGSGWYSHSDNASQMFPHTNLADEMEAAGLSWKGYMESLPYAGYTGAAYPLNTKNPLYVNKHDPFVLYPQIKNNPQRMKNVVPLVQLTQDLKTGNVPNLAYIVPNICNDMHGMSGTLCNYGDITKLRVLGDATIKRLVTVIMNSRTWKEGNNAIFITWDEGTWNGNKATNGWKSTEGGPDSPVLQPGSKVFPQGGIYGGGKIPMIVIASDYPGHYVSNVSYNHYSLLRTLEQAWRLPYLGYASDTMQVKTMAQFFEAHHAPRMAGKFHSSQSISQHTGGPA